MGFGTYTPEQLLGPLNEVEWKHAPSALYLHGDPSLLTAGPRVSVVGSRNASTVGIRRARILTRALVAHGVTVVSGLAEGIDSAAHETAINSGGKTVAVLGTSLAEVYPNKNRALQQFLMRTHLVVSQFKRGTPTRQHNFPRRNRTMALLSDATVIVEAGERSGTIHQGHEALRLGRVLFLLESVANDPGVPWTRELIHFGAQVLTRAGLNQALMNIPMRTSGVGGLF